jgi:hypothetical protein
LPPLSPALKRGVPVSSKFRIPIIVNSNWNINLEYK